MQKILVVTSSAHGAQSVSSRLARHFVDRLQDSRPDPELEIVWRDVGRDPIPHLVEENVAAIRGEPATEAEEAARLLSDQLIDELRQADLVVIGAPMYNFGMTSTLKSWFDHVLRARVTFRYTEDGPEGLLAGRKVVVIESRAGLYSEGPGAANDSQEPHIRTLLAFMGLTDVEWVRAERLAFGPEAAAGAIAGAEAQLAAIAARAEPQAAVAA